MKICVLSEKLYLTSSLHHHLDRRIQSSFAGIKSSIHSIAIRVRDLNGPRGGKDMLCQIVVALPGRPEIVIRESQKDLYAAIDIAVDRARYRTSQLLEKKRSQRKNSASAPTNLIGAC